MKKRLLTFILAVSMCASLLVGCGSSSENNSTESADESQVEDTEASDSSLESEILNPETETLNIAVVSNAARAGTSVLANELGYFEEEGLEVKMDHLNSPPDVTAALTSGKTDVSTMGITPQLNAISEGSDLTFIAGTGNADEQLFVRSEDKEEYSDLANLKGKKIGTTAESTLETVMKEPFEEAGISYPDDVELVSLSDYASVVQALQKGEIDAGFVTSLMNSAAESAGEVAIYNRFDAVCCRQTVRTEDIEANRSALVKMLIANIRAYEYYVTNEDSTIEVMADYTALDPEPLRAIFYQEGYVSVDPNKNGIEEIYESGNALGKLSGIDDIDAHIDTSLYYDALQILLEREPDNEVYNELLELYNTQN